MFIDIKDIGRINVARTGPKSGLPIVFLHPVGLDLTWWGGQFETFGHANDVVAFDMPGHGLSEPLDRAPTFEIMAQVLEAVVETIGGGPVHLVGHSVGGMIAQTFTLRRPELVRSLCLVGTLCSFPDEVRAALRDRAQVARHEGMARIAELSNARWFTPDFRTRRPDIVAGTTRSLLQQSAEFQAGMWEMIAGLDNEAELRSVSCPTLVVTGDLDINAPPTAAERIAQAIPGAQVRILPGVSHFPPLEATDAFNQILSELVGSANS